MRYRVILESFDRRSMRWWPPITTVMRETHAEAKVEALRLAASEDARSRITVTDDDYRLVEVVR